MIKETLLEDMKNAMKEKNIIAKNAIQMVRAAILQVEKDNHVELDDDKIIEVIAKETKKRKDSIAEYEKGGRQDIVKQINEEIKVLSKYLPEPMTDDELKKIIEEVIKETEATSMKDMGKVMKVAKEKVGARADGRKINEIVKLLLG